MSRFGGTFGKGSLDDVPTRANNDDLDDDFRPQSKTSQQSGLMKTRGYQKDSLGARNRGDAMQNEFKQLQGKGIKSPPKVKRGISDIIETMDDRAKENMF